MIANFSHRFIILEQLRQINLDFEVEKSIKIIFEPTSKNTFPTSVIASLFAKKHRFERVLLLPSDHVFQNEENFFEAFLAIEKFLSNKKDSILTFGATPTFGNTEYGYIEKSENEIEGEGEGEVFFVKKFTEKPSQEIAENYFQNKTHLWNLGIFYFLPDFFYEKARSISKNQIEIIEKSFENLKNIQGFFVLDEDIFEKVNNKSIDFALIEKLDCVFCKEVENLGWSDLGSFNQIYNLAKKDDNNNAINGLVKTNFSSNNHIINQTKSVIIADEINDLLIVLVDGFLTIRKRKNDRFNKIDSNDFEKK